MLLYFGSTVQAQTPGTFDPDFGDDGISRILLTTTGFFLDYANAMIIMPDDRILLVGDSFNSQTYEDQIILLMLNPDGTLDTSFGNGGYTLAQPHPTMHISNAKRAPDGKIVVTGNARRAMSGAIQDFIIGRFNADGTVDNTFGTNGFTSTRFGNIQDGGNEVIILQNGKLVVVGFVTISSNFIDRSFGIARYNANGTLDTSFGNGGMVTTSMSSRGDEPRRVHELPNGKILVTGYSNNGTIATMTAVRYNENGSLDASYGSGGIAAHAIGSGSSTGRQSILLSDGKLLMCGYSIVDDVSVITFIRINEDGSLDTTFGTDGVIQLQDGLTSLASSFKNSISDIFVQQDGKMVISGTRRNANGDDDIVLIRLLPDFTMDEEFGSGGVVFVDQIGSYGWELSTAVGMQSNGRILVSGYYSVSSISYAMVVLGFNSGFTPVSIDDSDVQLPGSITLHQNYPNPFNPGTRIIFELPESAEVQLDIYTLTGKKISTLVQSRMSAGTHTIDFDGSRLGSGVYMYRIRAGNHVESRIMTLIK